MEHDLNMVQCLIERCIQIYMDPAEVVDTLFHKAQIDPVVTKFVLQRLANENPEFFKEYNMRIALKKQIIRFNQLLEKLVEAKSKMNQNRFVPTPVANGSHTYSMNNYQCQTPNVYANGPLWQQPNTVGMQGHIGAVEIMNQTSQNGVMVHTTLANGSLIYSMNNNSNYQHQTPVAPGSMHHMVNSYPYAYTNANGASSSRQASMAHTGVVPTTVANGFLANSTYQHVTPSVKMQHVVPSVYANAASWQESIIQDGVGMQVDGSNAGMINGTGDSGGGKSSSSALREAMLALDNCSFGQSRQETLDFTIPQDLIPDFSDMLENSSLSPLVATDAGLLPTQNNEQGSEDWFGWKIMK